MEAMKIRYELDAPGFEEWLTAAVAASSLKSAAIALAAQISEGYLYRLMKGKQDAVSADGVERLEKVLESKFKRPD